MANDACMLSIIIPVYNGQNYIARCVSSLRTLSCPHEILLIDDGSTDDSLAYMQEAFREMPDCRVLHKENGGIVSARNYGLTQAAGRYVLFVDQDDHAVAETIDLAVQRCEKHSCDMAYWSTDVDQDGQVLPLDSVLQDTVAERNVIREEIIPAYLSKSRNAYVTSMGHLWGALFRRDVIRDHQLTFKRFVSYEDDYLFLLDYILVAERICFITDVGYDWVRYQESTSAELRYIADYWSRTTAMYSYVYETCRSHGITVPETMTTYVCQSVPLHALQNYTLVTNPNRHRELREWRQHMKSPEIQEAYRKESVRTYQGRDRRIFELLRRRLYTMAIGYAYMDALYHHLRSGAR